MFVISFSSPPHPSLSGCLKILYMRNHILSSNPMSLIHSDCYKKKPKDSGLGKKPNVFLTFLEFGKRKIECLMRACFLFHRWASLHYVLTWQKGQRSLWCLFFKCTNITYEGSVLMAQSPLKNHTSKYIED